MTIHREGHKILFGFLTVLIVLNGLLTYFFPVNSVLQWTGLGISMILFLLVLQFFRSPSREIQANANTVIAPADGKVVVIEKTVEDEYLKEERIQVSIFMSPLNVHINRAPVSGIFKFLKYHAGKYLVAWHPKSSTENERTTMVIQTPSGTNILFRQIAGAVARRIKWYVSEGDSIEQGQEFGFIRFGSRVDVFLPLDAKVKVEINQKTVGGKTVLAELN